MRVRIRANDHALAQAMRSYITRRLRLTLGRFAACVAEVTALIADADGGDDGADRGGRVSLEFLPSGRRLRHEMDDPCLFSAVDTAVERMNRSVATGREVGVAPLAVPPDDAA